MPDVYWILGKLFAIAIGIIIFAAYVFIKYNKIDMMRAKKDLEKSAFPPADSEADTLVYQGKRYNKVKLINLRKEYIKKKYGSEGLCLGRLSELQKDKFLRPNDALVDIEIEALAMCLAEFGHEPQPSSETKINNVKETPQEVCGEQLTIDNFISEQKGLKSNKADAANTTPVPSLDQKAKKSKITLVSLVLCGVFLVSTIVFASLYAVQKNENSTLQVENNKTASAPQIDPADYSSPSEYLAAKREAEGKTANDYETLPEHLSKREAELGDDYGSNVYSEQQSDGEASDFLKSKAAESRARTEANKAVWEAETIAIFGEEAYENGLTYDMMVEEGLRN